MVNEELATEGQVRRYLRRATAGMGELFKNKWVKVLTVAAAAGQGFVRLGYSAPFQGRAKWFDERKNRYIVCTSQSMLKNTDLLSELCGADPVQNIVVCVHASFYALDLLSIHTVHRLFVETFLRFIC